MMTIQPMPRDSGAPIPNPALAAMFLQSREETCNERTRATYTAAIGSFVTWLAERPISAMAISGYLIQRREQRKRPTTLENDYRMLKTMCRYLVERGLLDTDPFSGPGRVRPLQHKRQRRPVYSDAEIVQLLAATFVQAANKRRPELTRQRWSTDGPHAREAAQARALVLLLCDSALRAEEVCRLSCGQIRANELIVISKGGHEDAAFVGPETRAALLELAHGRPDGSPLFRDWHGGRCTTRAIRGLVERLARRAGVTPPPRPVHAFRHYTARQWVKAGLGDLVIQQLMRHSSLQTTQIYTQLDAAELAELHAGASPVARLLAAAVNSVG